MRMTNILRAGVVALAALLLAACPDDVEKSKEAQQEVMKTAFAAVPPYRPRAFPARENINWYLQQTEKGGAWYIYALAMDGRPLFYVVSDMKPRNICISITSPDRYIGNGGSMSAPALDGVYYGGAGCDSYYMRDAATGGYIELSGRTFTLVTSRAPLFLETDIQRLQPNRKQVSSTTTGSLSGGELTASTVPKPEGDQ